ncbi:MAG: protein kinase [Prevotella sp.]|nr:protein kinase [Prevotella sp.]
MRQIANYTVEDKPLARGGMGQIFRGHDSQGHVVAIKEILPEFANDLTIVSRIEKEVEFLVKIDHPSIVRLYSAFRDPGTHCYYIVMEFVEGVNIEQYIMRNGTPEPMPEQQAVEYMLKILDAMQCVHNAHIVHRDIKPSNIMIRPDGNVCLLDFGVAKDMDNGAGTIVGSIIGTSGYMSPEQADGFSINSRSDIYSLGCVFFYMLTGHHAFNTLASEFETKNAILTNKFPRLSKYKSGLSDVLQKVLDKATDKNMMHRYQSCYEFMAALRNGTQISYSGAQKAQVSISVGREMCDIILEDSEQKISRHHADIEIREFTGGKFYVFTDCSANGTIIDGKKVNKQSVNIPANGKVPEIYLAGVKDGHLDWEKVVAEMDKRVQAIQVAENPGSGGMKQEQPAFVYKEKDATGWLIVSYIFALLGGLLGIAFGLMVYMGKVEMVTGEKFYKYKQQHRYMGLGAAIIGVIAIIVYNVMPFL